MQATSTMAQVLIIGGGYAGTAVAKALDAHAAVTLIEPRERFFHNIGALRAAVDAQWLEKLFIPYNHLLQRGDMLRDKASSVAPHQVVLASGQQLNFDYLVLATRSSYPFPAKMTATDVAPAAADVQRVNARIRNAASILLIGGGPVGIEFAGEIATAYPGKRVTLIDRSPALLEQLNPRMGQLLKHDLETLGVRLILGEQLVPPPHGSNALASTVSSQTFTTDRGTSIDADLYFTCFGVGVTTDYLRPGLADALTDQGQVKVAATLQVAGHPQIFAVGDITDLPEAKMAATAAAQGAIVAENIRRLIIGRADLKQYKPARTAALVVPVGSTHGTAPLPLGSNGLVIGAWAASRIKGRTLFVDRFWKSRGATPPKG